MKKSLILIRWIVGLLFIFSGLIKANDPLGLSYKMQEFFEVWGMSGLNDYTLGLSLVMNVFEVIAGVAVIIGWRMRLFSWLLLLLIIFFCFLTGYAFITGNIKTCGCFGDCLPLTPLTSFIKDVVLLILIIILFINRNYIQPSVKPPLPQILLLLCFAGVCIFQYYVLNYLPVVDCLPYKTGSNIVENMRVVKEAEPDIYALTFKYKKNGKILEYTSDNLPADLDSTYEFIERYQKLIKKGTGDFPVFDFTLQNMNGADTTFAILNKNHYYLLFANDFSNFEEWHNKDFDELLQKSSAKHLPLFVVTSDKDNAVKLLGGDTRVNILTCDGTVIKTAARVNPTYYVMQSGNIQGKYSYKNIERVINQINTAPANKDFEDF